MPGGFFSAPSHPIGRKEARSTMRLNAATDGSCSPNPGKGGWAWVLENGKYDSGAESQTTNNRMELLAVYKLLETVEEPLTVFIDSQYVMNTLKIWYPKWKASGKKYKNPDIIDPLFSLYKTRQIEWVWVRGHTGHVLNEQADSLATKAASGNAA